MRFVAWYWCGCSAQGSRIRLVDRWRAWRGVPVDVRSRVPDVCPMHGDQLQLIMEAK